MVKRIGRHFARILVRAFGDKVLDVIEESPDRLLELAGIGRKRKERVIRAWAEQKAIREIDYGLSAIARRRNGSFDGHL